MTTRLFFPPARAAALALALAATAAGAHAQSAGSWLLRGGVTRIDPQVDSGDLSAPSFVGTKVDVHSSTRLSGGVSYMVTDHWALDVPLALPFKHDIVGEGAIAGVGKIGEVKVVPTTLFGQYRFFEAESRIRPYLGVGLTYAKFYKGRGTAALSGLTGGSPANPTSLKTDSKFAVTPQIGVTIALGGRWFADLSYQRTLLKTDTTLTTGQHITTRLNPDTITLGVGYWF